MKKNFFSTVKGVFNNSDPTFARTKKIEVMNKEE